MEPSGTVLTRADPGQIAQETKNCRLSAQETKSVMLALHGQIAQVTTNEIVYLEKGGDLSADGVAWAMGILARYILALILRIFL
jgi:hypothetical protein